MSTQAPKTSLAWVLHRRPWRESSALVDVITQHYGRLALVARSARSERSPWRGLVEPFVPLVLSFTQKGEMGTVTDLEMAEARCHLTGRALWCGLYANELLLTLIDRDDPIDALFDHYGELIHALASDQDLARPLRLFEWQLLSFLGIAPSLTHQANGGEAIMASLHYRLDPEAGFEVIAPTSRHAISGEAIVWMANAMMGEVSPAVASGALKINRLLIDHQLSGRTLKTRTLLRQLQ